MNRLAVASVTLLAVLVPADPVAARPPPPPDDIAYTPAATVTLIEWSTWLRGGFGVAHGEAATDPTPRALVSPTNERDRTLAGAAGLGLTLPAGRHVRLGAWAELRGWDLPLVGGELTLIPGNLDLFQYTGKSAITLRAGGNPDLLTAQLGLGYRAPWDLFGKQPRNNRYIIGASLVATVTQSRFDPHDWSATVGLELEPLGALRYVLGVRSWY